MNILSKKIVVGLMAGAVLTAGALGTYTAQASANTQKQQAQEQQNKAGRQQPPKMDPDKAAQGMAEAFGVNKDEVLTAINAKKDFRDISHAAMLAKVSGKSFSDVLAMKTDSNKWQDVEKTLGVTRDQVKAAQDDMMAGMLEKKANVSKDKAASLLQDGYHAKDIAAAGILAKTANKDIDSVLSMKKINNSWKDVAASLGVDEKAFHEAMKSAGGPGLMMEGPKGGPHDGQQQGGRPAGQQGDADGNGNGGEPPQPPTEE